MNFEDSPHYLTYKIYVVSILFATNMSNVPPQTLTDVASLIPKNPNILFDTIGSLKQDLKK